MALSFVELTAADIERFWSRVNKRDPDECWEWTGGRHKKSYGYFYKQRRQHQAHRLSWQLANGPIPDGLWVLHRCDNHICVNPHHLFVGTAGENNADRDQKGRTARGTRHGSHTHPERWHTGEKHWSHVHPERRVRGARHGNAKLTDQQVAEIRQLFETSPLTLAEIAERFHITIGHVSTIGRGLRSGSGPVTLHKRPARRRQQEVASEQL